MSKEKSECIVMGKVLGTYSDWDQPDTLCIYLIDFEPNETGLKFINKLSSDKNFNYCLSINFDTGCVTLDTKIKETINPNWSVFNA